MIQSNERGLSLLETMIAVAILLVAITAVMSLFTVAVAQNANQGEYATRATEYAQDKMEQLLALDFTNVTTNTTVYPPVPLGGTGLNAGCAGGGCGSINLAAPLNGYVDYLSASGNLLPNANGWFYKRQWRIDLIAVDLKRVSVVTTIRTGAGRGILPTTTLVSMKANLP
jgi:type II secretory pathway pseudopilin PulG